MSDAENPQIVYLRVLIVPLRIKQPRSSFAQFYPSEPDDLDDSDAMPRAPFNTPETLSSTDSSPTVSPRFDYSPSFQESYLVRIHIFKIQDLQADFVTTTKNRPALTEVTRKN